MGDKTSNIKLEAILILFILLSNTAIVANWVFNRPEEVTSVTKDSTEIPVKPNAVSGYLDRMILNNEAQVEMEGWAFDSRNSRLVDEIIFRYDGELVYKGKNNRARPDLVNVFGDDALMGGFRFVLPLTLFKDKEIDNSKIRLFAVSNGVASELNYFRGFK